MRRNRLDERLDMVEMSALGLPDTVGGLSTETFAASVVAILGLSALTWIVLSRSRGATPNDNGSTGADVGTGGAPAANAPLTSSASTLPETPVPDVPMATHDAPADAPASTPAPSPASTPAPVSMPPGNGLIRDEVRNTWAQWSADFEGRVPTMYVDVATASHPNGLVTVGVGNMIDPVSLALPLAWLKSDGTPATQDEIKAEWNRVKSMGPSHRFTYYQSPDGLHLSDDTIDAMVLKQLDANAVVLQRYFPDFASYPAGAQRAILSIAWAVGAGFPPKWPKFTTAVKAHDWTTAADEGTLNTTGNPGLVKRNAANRAALLEAASQENSA